MSQIPRNLCLAVIPATHETGPKTFNFAEFFMWLQVLETASGLRFRFLSINVVLASGFNTFL